MSNIYVKATKRYIRNSIPMGSIYIIENNEPTGPIPMHLGNLRALRELNLCKLMNCSYIENSNTVYHNLISL